MAQVKVSLVRKSDNDPIQVEVALRSNSLSMSGPKWSYLVLDVDSDIQHKVEVAGGALAEHQIALYADKHDPSEVARVAKETFRKVLLEHKTGPGKLFIS